MDITKVFLSLKTSSKDVLSEIKTESTDVLKNMYTTVCTNVPVSATRCNT